MLNSKQRATLRSMASQMDSIMQIGKGGLTQELVESVDHALEARELIKMTTLETAPLDARAAAEQLAEAVSAEVVATVGRKLILYRPTKNKKKQKIFL